MTSAATRLRRRILGWGGRFGRVEGTEHESRIHHDGAGRPWDDGDGGRGSRPVAACRGAPDDSLGQGRIAGKRPSGVPPAADGPLPVAESQRTLGRDHRTARGPTAHGRSAHRADPRPLSRRVGPFRPGAAGRSHLVSADVPDTPRLAKRAGAVALPGRRLGDHRLRQRPAGRQPPRRLRCLLLRRHRVPQVRRARGARRRRLRSHQPGRPAPRQAGRRSQRHLVHALQRHLADRLAGAGARRANRRADPRARRGRLVPLAPGRRRGHGPGAHGPGGCSRRQDGRRPGLRRRGGQDPRGACRGRPEAMVARRPVPLRPDGQPLPRRPAARRGPKLLRHAQDRHCARTAKGGCGCA